MFLRFLNLLTFCRLATVQALITPSIYFSLRRYQRYTNTAKPITDFGLSLSSSNDYDNEGPEKSLMYRYISDFLNKASNDVEEVIGDDLNQECTHLIAIPVDSCHELLLELESIQRAILFHCPILVHACIAPAVVRLPLLYVHVPDGVAGASTTLQRIVQELVKEVIYVQAENNSNISSDESSMNPDGIQPVILTFQGLEIDDGLNTNSANEVLSTVGTDQSYGTLLLKKLIGVLQDRIRTEFGWKTVLPADPQNIKKNENDNIPTEYFRPRIPFMRLPDDWESNHLMEQLKQQNAISQASESSYFSEVIDPDDIYMLTSDDGGNGISPILWGKWMDDTFGVDIRLREIAVYKRSAGVSGFTEKSFYLPDSASISLPIGNAVLSKGEAKFQAYNDKRLNEAEIALRNDINERKSMDKFDENEDENVLLMKTKSRLESIYSDSDDANTFMLRDDTPVLDSFDPIKIDLNQAEPFKLIDLNQDADTIDESMKERIQKAVQSRARVKSQIELATKKNKPPIEQNNIFSKFKDGTLVPAKEISQRVRELPPFPSREHFIGFWRVIGSPTGFSVEESDSSRSDNLVLRVDGTTTGGPILDQETRQKASGGTWKLLRDNTNADNATATIRIRLVIPPKKERILVMEGKVEKLSMSLNLPMTSSTFGIPALEMKAKAALANDKSEIEDSLYCSGLVWIEDATMTETKREASDKCGKESIGTFSLMKLNTPSDPKEFTITTPRATRNQD